MNRTISNSDNVIDSRDVIARIEELQSERGAFAYDNDELVDPQSVWAERNTDDADELAALATLADEAEGYTPDWHHGATLIRDSYFEDYAQMLAEDCGMLDRDATWPQTCIDWEEAARELQMDYTSVEFDGVTYWVR